MGFQALKMGIGKYWLNQSETNDCDFCEDTRVA